MLGAAAQRRLDPGVDAAGEAAVLGQRDELHVGMGGGDRLDRPVARAVVDEDDPHVRVRQRSERAEAAQRQLAVVPREDDDRHPGAHASSRR